MRGALLTKTVGIPNFFGEVREVRPDFRLHQQAEVRLSSFQKLLTALGVS